MTPKSKKRTIFLTLLSGFLIVFALFMSFKRSNLSQGERIIKKARKLGLTQDQANLVLAISKHETGNLTSELCQPPINNYFGMTYPSKRTTTASGKLTNNFATFETIEDSVEDFLLWWKQYSLQFTQSPEDMVYYMKQKGYFEDTYENYLNGVKYWVNH